MTEKKLTIYTCDSPGCHSKLEVADERGVGDWPEQEGWCSIDADVCMFAGDKKWSTADPRERTLKHACSLMCVRNFLLAFSWRIQ